MGRALRLGGSAAAGGTDLVSVAAHADFARPAGAKLTMTAWARFDATLGHHAIVSIDHGTVNETYGIDLESTTVLT